MLPPRMPNGTPASSTSDSVTAAPAPPARQLVAVSAAALLFELAFIRYANSTVQILAYFTNFLVISAFLGLGVGSLLRKRNWMLDVFPFLAALVLLVLGFLDRFGFAHGFEEQVLFPLAMAGYTMPA